MPSSFEQVLSLLNRHRQLFDDVGFWIGLSVGSVLLLLSLGFIGFWLLARLLITKEPTGGQTFGFCATYLFLYTMAVAGCERLAAFAPSWAMPIIQWAILVPLLAIVIVIVFQAPLARAITCAPLFALFAVSPTLFFNYLVQPRIGPAIAQAKSGVEELIQEMEALAPVEAPANDESEGGATAADAIVADPSRSVPERAFALRRAELQAAYRQVAALHEQARNDPNLKEGYAKKLKLYNDALAQLTADQTGVQPAQQGQQP